MMKIETVCSNFLYVANKAAVSIQSKRNACCSSHWAWTSHNKRMQFNQESEKSENTSMDGSSWHEDLDIQTLQEAKIYD